MNDCTANMVLMARSTKIISDFDRKLGGAIKHRRLDPDYGMSQGALSKATGIPLSNLQRREDGDNEVTVSELERIAVALQTTPLALVEVALARYGGLEKLVAEYAFKPVSALADNVNDIAEKRDQKQPLGDDWDEYREKGVANLDAENEQDESDPA